MGKVNYAAIDIGSNAVRLLIKSIDREAVQEQKIKKVMMLRVPLRLGFDVFSIGELSEKKADKLRRLFFNSLFVHPYFLTLIFGSEFT